MLQMPNILHIISLHCAPWTPRPTLNRLVPQMERVVTNRGSWHHQARLATAGVLGRSGVNRPYFGIAPLHAGGFLDPTDALMAYLVCHSAGDGIPPQDNFAKIFLTLDEIPLRPLPVLLDAGLVDGKLRPGWLITSRDGPGACSESDCKERKGAIHVKILEEATDVLYGGDIGTIVL
jgi:hypothetical protein